MTTSSQVITPVYATFTSNYVHTCISCISFVEVLSQRNMPSMHSICYVCNRQAPSACVIVSNPSERPKLPKRCGAEVREESMRWCPKPQLNTALSFKKKRWHQLQAEGKTFPTETVVHVAIYDVRVPSMN